MTSGEGWGKMSAPLFPEPERAEDLNPERGGRGKGVPLHVVHEEDKALHLPASCKLLIGGIPPAVDAR